MSNIRQIGQFNHLVLRALPDIRGSHRNLCSLFVVFTVVFGISLTAEIDIAMGARCPLDTGGGGSPCCYEEDRECTCSGSTCNFERRQPRFKINGFEVPPNMRDGLLKIAKEIKSLPAGTVIEIRGHTDSTGSQAANKVLSQHRADAVREELIRLGVPRDVLRANGYGELGAIRNRTVSYAVVRY